MGWVTRWELDDQASPEFKAAVEKMNRELSKFEKKAGTAGRAHVDGMKRAKKATDQTKSSVGGLAKQVQTLITLEAGRRVAVGLFNMAKEADSARLAMMGLERVAKGTHQDFGKVEAAMKTAGQGMLKFNTRATGLRNLMLAGLGADEAADMMNTFVDIASIGRSSTITLSDAVLNLTQAFKTEQSELGDLSGMTANFSEIMKVGARRAKELGLELDKADTKMLGIKELHKTLEGAAVDATTGLAGATNELTIAWENFSLEVGKELSPNMTWGIKTLTGLLGAFTPSNPQDAVDQFWRKQQGASVSWQERRRGESSPAKPEQSSPPSGMLWWLPPVLAGPPPRPVMQPEQPDESWEENFSPGRWGHMAGRSAYDVGQSIYRPGGDQGLPAIPELEKVEGIAQGIGVEFSSIERIWAGLGQDVHRVGEDMAVWGIDELASGLADVVVHFREIEDIGRAILDVFKNITQELIRWAIVTGIKFAIKQALTSWLPGDVGGGGGDIAPDFGYAAQGGVMPGVSYFSPGGIARGTDTIPAMLSPGEGILTAEATRRIGGVQAIDAINSGGSAGVSQEIHIHGPVTGDGGIRALAALIHPHTRSLITSNGYEGLH